MKKNILITLFGILFVASFIYFMAKLSINQDKKHILADLFRNDCEASRMYYYTEECLEDLDYCKIAIAECKRIKGIIE